MSTEANAALAWPVEITEIAEIGNKLVERKKTPKQVTTLWTYLEMADGKRTPDDLAGTPLELCGTTIPGNINLPCLRDSDTGFDRDHPEARMHWSNEALAYICAPFVGDWLSDPRVIEEGTENGNWLSYAEWERELLAPSGCSCSVNEPTERCGYCQAANDHAFANPEPPGYVDGEVLAETTLQFPSLGQFTEYGEVTRRSPAPPQVEVTDHGTPAPLALPTEEDSDE